MRSVRLPLILGLSALLGCGGGNLTVSNGGAGVVVTINPAAATLAPSETRLFNATVTGTTNHAVTWGVLGGSANGSFTGSTGLYTAPNASGTYVLTATSAADSGRLGTATVTVAGPLVVRVSPAALSLPPGGTQTFSATLNGSASSALTWSVVEAGGGGITSGGVYTAPPVPGAYTIKATAQADGLSAGTALVTVSPVTLNLSPPAATLDQGATQLFTPILSGTSNLLVAWNGGSPQTGPYLYTAPASAGVKVLKAVPSAAPGLEAVALITVNPVAISALSPANPVLPAGRSLAFSATVTGSTNRAVAWKVLSGGVNGTINSEGLYTAPTTGAGSDTIVATASADPTVTRSVVVTVGSVTISPASPSAVAATTGRLTFSATVTGVADPGVTWDILPVANGGSITAVGYFSAPTQPGVYRVRATSVVNPALFGEVQVTVN